MAPDQEPSADDSGGPQGWIAIGAGLGTVATGLVAIFVVSGHDAPITTALVTGVALLFGGVLLPRLSGDFEIGPTGLKGKLVELRKVVTKAEGTLAGGQNSGLSDYKASGAPSAIDAVLREAGHSPIAALVLLSRAIEHELRLLLEQTGWVPGNQRMGIMQMIAAAERRNAVSPSLTSSVRVFWDVRNQVIHAAKSIPDSEVLSAIDIGATILRMIEGIPHEVHTVERTGLRLFTDPDASLPLEDYTGLRLDSVSPGGTRVEKRIFPTRRTDYQPGQLVGWEWNLESVVPETWYRDPDDDSVKLAWNGSAEFVGRPLPKSH